ncbi:MAG: NrdH-redoxin [Gemmatimonadales bacterium]
MPTTTFSAVRARRRALAASFVLAALPLSAVAQAPEPTGDPVDLLVFVGHGCPHCERALVWLADLSERRPDLRADVHDVVRDPEAMAALRRLATERGLAAVSVPTFVVRGDRVLVGFTSAETTGGMLESLLGDEQPEDGRGPAAATEVGPLDRPTIEVPLIGVVALDDVGLAAFTVVLGLLDGFNPCAMWVLLFLLSMLVGVGSRARMAMIGGVFVLVSGLVYYAFMAAWLNAFLFLGMSRWIQVTLGGVALALGGLNLKDFFWMGRGPSLGIPEAAKPTIYARVRRVVTAERLGAALGTATVLALLVNVVELLCTAGLPALYTRILTLHELSRLEYHAYLLLYDLFYMLDDALMLGIAVVTLSHHRLQRREARWLKLLSGAVMLGLGVVLLVQPDWLTG